MEMPPQSTFKILLKIKLYFVLFFKVFYFQLGCHMCVGPLTKIINK